MTSQICNTVSEEKLREFFGRPEAQGIVQRGGGWEAFYRQFCQGLATVVVQADGVVLATAALWETKHSRLYELGTVVSIQSGCGIQVIKKLAGLAKQNDWLLFAISPNDIIARHLRSLGWIREQNPVMVDVIRPRISRFKRELWYCSERSRRQVEETYGKPMRPPEVELERRSHDLRRAAEYFYLFRHKTFVIKCGGEVLQYEYFSSLLYAIALLRVFDINVVMVHGAQPQIDAALTSSNLPVGEKIDGIRVTAPVAMPVIAAACRAASDAIARLGNEQLLDARFVPICPLFGTVRPDDHINYGRTGIVTGMNGDILENVMSHAIPVLSPLVQDSVDSDSLLNVNADEIAQWVAEACSAYKLLFLTGQNGVLDSAGIVRSFLTAAEAEGLLASGCVTGGMTAKVRSCIAAVRGRVGQAHIVNYKNGALLGELLSDFGTGTMIYNG
jgi:acetylglutamate kinase